MLTIDLLPKEFLDIRSSLGETEWNKIAKIISNSVGNRCEICYDTGPDYTIECQAIWDFDDIRHCLTLSGFIALCPACYEAKNMLRAMHQGRGEIAILHLGKVNEWSVQQTRDYIEEQLKIFERRSQYHWIDDISWLLKLEIFYPEIKKLEVFDPDGSWSCCCEGYGSGGNLDFCLDYVGPCIEDDYENINDVYHLLLKEGSAGGERWSVRWEFNFDDTEEVCTEDILDDEIEFSCYYFEDFD
jgi:hypothetical protein